MSRSLLDLCPELSRLRQVLTWQDLADAPPYAAAEQALEAWAVLDESFEDPASAECHRDLAAMLQSVASDGVVAAHEARASRLRAAAPERIRPALNELDEAVGSWLGGDSDALLEAEEAWLGIARGPVLNTMEPTLLLSLMCDGAALHEAAFALHPTRERLDDLVGLLEDVTRGFVVLRSRPTGCRLHVDPRLTRCTGRLAVALRERYDAFGGPHDLQRARELVEATVTWVHPYGPDSPVWRLERAVVLGYGSEADLAEAVRELDDVAALEPADSALRVRALDLGGRGAWADYRADPTGAGRPRLDDAVRRWQDALDAGAGVPELLPVRLATARLARFLELGASGPDAAAAADALGAPPDTSSARRLVDALGPWLGQGSPETIDLSDLGIEVLRRLADDPGSAAAAEEVARLAVLVAGEAERLPPDDRSRIALDLLRAAGGLTGATVLADQVRAGSTVGALLMRLYDGTGDVIVLVRAVDVLGWAADQAQALGAAERVRLLSNLVAALRARSDRAERPDDLREAGVRADEAVALADAGGDDADRVVALSSRAQVRHDRWRTGGGADDLHAAVADWRAVMALGATEERWLTAYNLGNALVSLEDPGVLDEAVGFLVAAIRNLSRTATPDAALAAGRLAEALHRRSLSRPPADPDRERRRVARWSARAVRWARAVSPETLMAVAWDWGGRATAVGDHESAATAYTAATDALASLVAANRLVTAKESWLAEGFGLGTRAAAAMVRCGRPDGAVLALERARALVLRDALGRGPDGSTPPDLQALRGGLDQPALYLVPAQQEGLALLLDPAQEHARAISLPGLTESAVGGRVRAFHRAAAAATRSPQAWRRTLDRTVEWLGEVVAPALATLRAERITLVPTGALAFLPVHAARAGEAWVLADRVVVELAPAVTALLAARHRPQGAAAGPVLAVVDPAPTSLPGLRFARHEAAAAAALGPVTDLVGEAASVEAVVDALPSAAVLHLACHGRADVLRPRESGLVLRDDLRLTVDRLAGLDLDHARLAFLSACETGVPGAEAPDEVVTLGSAFFAAGVDGVVSSLWQVSDLATLLLVVCFYAEPAAATDPALALAAAQRRMRTSTTRALTAYLTQLRDAGRLDASTWQVLEQALRPHPAEAVPYAHPDAWAGFVFSGSSRARTSP